MSNVINAFPGGVVSPDQVTAMNAFDAAIVGSIDEAKHAGVPQGLIVALLHGHTHLQTQIMVERA